MPSTGPFVDKSCKLASPQTDLRFAYDQQNLYLAIRVEEPEMGQVTAKVTEHDGGVWKDDDLEIFLGTKGGATPYLVFRINSLGVQEETSMDADAASFNVPWQGKVTREKDAWVAEIAIPFSSLDAKAPSPGSIWYGNVCRNRAHAKQLSSWSKVPGSFNDPGAFGQLYFTDKILFHAIKITPSERKDGAGLKVEASGPPSQYRLRILANLDGTPPRPVPPELYGVLNITPGKLTGTDHTLLRPEVQRIVLQPELMEFEKPNTILFRGEAILAKETDPVLANISAAAKLLQEFPREHAPSLFHDLAPTWELRMAELKKTPDAIKVQALLQELRSAEWLSRLSEEATSQTILTFPTTPFTEVDYNVLPDPKAVGEPLAARAMRGEYVPSCLNVYALDRDHDILVLVSDLTGPGGATLPGSAFDVRVLKGWYQAGHGGFQDPGGQGVWANELLLKDDSIITSDDALGRNTIYRTTDTPELHPAKVKRFQSRQFWLTLRVPENQMPGLYAGKVRVTDGDAELATVPLQVEVLPLTMEKGHFTYTMYYYSRLGKGDSTDRLCEADLKMMAEYGFTSAFVHEGAASQPSSDGKVTDYDFSSIRQALELRKKYGLTGRTVLTGGLWSTPPVAAVLRESAEKLSASPVSQHNWKLFGQGFAELAGAEGFEAAYTYGLDEPGYDATGKKMRAEKILCTWATEAHFNVASAITVSAAESIKDVLALPILDSPSAVIGPNRRTLPLPGEAWLYWHPDERPTYDRLLAGLFLWYGGYSGAAPWIYEWKGDTWDDWLKNAAGYRLMNYAYPGDEGPVPTRQLAAFREGSNDVKYLEMLQNRVKELSSRQNQLDESTRTAWTAADHLLNHAPLQFQGSSSSLPDRVDGQMLADFRRQIADLLVKLSPPAKDSKDRK
ncbi:hypothetical protein BH09VER1_BH09VER1_46400 [soil metagenome]